MKLRGRLAAKHLSGSGIEIGGLHAPLRVPSGATVRYVDRATTAELRRLYPDLGLLRIVDVDVVDDGENLVTFEPSSLDFIIANHVIEHCENPLRTLERWLSLLRPGGVIYMAVPDQRKTFDRQRPLTSFEHVLRDYSEGPAGSRRDHLREYARLVDHVPEADVEGVVDRWLAEDTRPHYHAWTPRTFREMLERARELESMTFSVEALSEAPDEFIAILRLTGPAGTAG
ncbi:MAG TPA: methyltransferase domain-containing protein [Longimicrobiales bacterium]|nr:methyltransferase domain-containing protein [Longimicrobiales bacterium]